MNLKGELLITSRNKFANNIQNKYKTADTINVNLDNRAKGLFDGMGLSYQKIPTLNHNQKLPDQIEGVYRKDNLSLRKNPRVSDKKAEAVAMHEIYHHIQRDKGMNLVDEEQEANLIEKAYLSENQEVSQEPDFDLIYAHTIRQFYEHDELEKLVRIFGGNADIARRLYSSAMLLIKESNPEDNIEKSNSVTKNISGVKKVSTSDSFDVKTKILDNLNETSIDNELISFREDSSDIENPKYKIKGLASWGNSRTDSQTISFYFIAKCSKDGFLEPDPEDEITNAISSKLNIFSKELKSERIALIVVNRIDNIHKGIRLVPQRYYKYKIRIVINNFHLSSVSVDLENLKSHKGKSLEFEKKEETRVFLLKEKELEKEAEIDGKLEKIYDAKLEKVVDRKLDEAGKKFIKYIQIISQGIELSHSHYKKAYDNIGVIGHMSHATNSVGLLGMLSPAVGGFRFLKDILTRPKIDKYWEKALKLSKEVELNELNEIEKWKKEVKAEFENIKFEAKIPWHIKEKIGDEKGYEALDAWIEGRGTNDMIALDLRFYHEGLDGRLSASLYELKMGERAWNEWVNESIEGAEKSIFLLTIIKDASDIYASVIGGPVYGTLHSLATSTATQVGNKVFLDKDIDYWEILKTGSLSLLGGLSGKVLSEKVATRLLQNSKIISLIGKNKFITKDIVICMSNFLTDSAVKEVLNIAVAEVQEVADNMAGKPSAEKSSKHLIHILSSDPFVQNFFANIVLNKCGKNKIEKLNSQNKFVKILE